MPTTRSQKSLFTLMMGFAMVYGMEVYNGIIRLQGVAAHGESAFIMPVGDTVLLVITVCILQSFVCSPLVGRIAWSVAHPERYTPQRHQTAVKLLTVTCMCPLMSFVAVAMYKGLDGNVLEKWVMTTLTNYPMALCWQMLVAGPLVRMLYRRMTLAELI